MLIFNKEHKQFFQEILNFFHSNRKFITSRGKWHVGKNQTDNFLTHTLNIDYKRLPYEYNMCDMFRKELLDDELTAQKWG